MSQLSKIKQEQTDITGGGGGLTNPVPFLEVADPAQTQRTDPFDSGESRLSLENTIPLDSGNYGVPIQFSDQDKDNLFGAIVPAATSNHNGNTSVTNTSMIEHWNSKGQTTERAFRYGQDPNDNPYFLGNRDNFLEVFIAALFQNIVFSKDLRIQDLSETLQRSDILNASQSRLALKNTPALDSGNYGSPIQFLDDDEDNFFGVIVPKGTSNHNTNTSVTNTAVIEHWACKGQTPELAFRIGNDQSGPLGFTRDNFEQHYLPTFFENDVTFANGVNFSGLPQVSSKARQNSLSSTFGSSQTFPAALDFGNIPKPDESNDILVEVGFEVQNNSSSGTTDAEYSLEIDGQIVSAKKVAHGGSENDQITLYGLLQNVTDDNFNVRVRCQVTTGSTTVINQQTQLNSNFMHAQIFRAGELT